MDSASFVVSAGEALVASIGDMTSSSTNKLRDVSRKVTLVRLLDERSSSSSSRSNSNNTNSSADDKENNSSSAITNAPGRSAVFSERSSNNNDNSSIGGGTSTLQANRGGLEALRDLRDLSSIVSEVERRAAALREVIESHRRDNIARREMSQTTRQQTAQLAATLSALPEHLPHAAAPLQPKPTQKMVAAAAAAIAAAAAVTTGGEADSSAAAAAAVACPATRSAVGNRRSGADPAASNLTEVPVLELVTVGELNGVPRSTRARLTIEQVNAAVTEIQKAVERRYAIIGTHARIAFLLVEPHVEACEVTYTLTECCCRSYHSASVRG